MGIVWFAAVTGWAVLGELGWVDAVGDGDEGPRRGSLRRRGYGNGTQECASLRL